MSYKSIIIRGFSALIKNYVGISYYNYEVTRSSSAKISAISIEFILGL